MYGDIAVKELGKLKNSLFIDLRSPEEYRQGSIPGAINIPLLDDQEREVIGLLYKEDRHRAGLKGLSLVTPKLPAIIEKVKNISSNKTPILYCWRGGARSKSIYILLEMLNIPAYRLEGGYKSYRRFILDQLANYALKMPVFVLNGLTGAGKTEVLHLLAEGGCPTLDLEKLACHRGSLFGHLGIKTRRRQKDFDALLWNCLEAHKDADYLIVEGEGKRIGPVYQPDFLYRAIQEGKHILLKAPLENRVKRLLREYYPASDHEIQNVRAAILLLKKYLGAKTTEHLLLLLEQGRFFELVSQLCTVYYDRLYSDAKPENTAFALVVNSSNPAKAAEEVKDFIYKTVERSNQRERL